MRLIDADKIDFSRVFGGQSAFAKDLILAAQELIDMQPTAFDKEKTIKELKQNRDIAEAGYKAVEEFGHDGSELLGKATAFNLAMAIVEKGGIE